jgi:HNH endonuclease
VSFPSKVREKAVLAAGRCCCICHTFCGRNTEVHHIVQEADGGPNTIENAIPLCFDCHAEAGHYNPRHPLGTKYSSGELRRHRDEWFKTCAASAMAMGSLPLHPIKLPPASAEFEVIERDVGTLWSRLANKPECREVVRFRGAELGSYRQEEAGFNSDNWELFLVRGRRFLVYHKRIERGDWCWASLRGKWGEMDFPLSLDKLQEEYPELATSAGFARVRVLDV